MLSEEVFWSDASSVVACADAALILSIVAIYILKPVHVIKKVV